MSSSWRTRPSGLRFGVMLKQFLTTLDVVLPRPKALPFVKDAKRFGLIQKVARRRYRDDGPRRLRRLPLGEKVRKLIDEHVTALDIATKIPPVSITAPDFLAKVKGLTSDKAKASEMEHALRYHIRKNFDEDPARYTKLSERLDEILKTLTGKWDQLALALEELLSDVVDEPASDARARRPARRSVLSASWRASSRPTPPCPTRFGSTRASGRRHRGRGCSSTRASCGSGSNPHAQDELRKKIIHVLDDRDLFPFAEQAAVADRLMELAQANQSLIAQTPAEGSS